MIGTRKSAWTVLCGVAVAGVIAAGLVYSQTATVTGKTKQVVDFEDAAIWSSENNSPFALSTEHVTQGAHSLKVNLTNKPDWPNIYTKKMLADWSAFRYLNFDVWLEGNLPAQMGMWMRDKAMHKAETSYTVGPGANTVTIDLDEMKKTGGLEPNDIVGICVYKEGKEEITFYIDNMYLSEEKPVTPVLPPVQMPATELVQNGGFEDVQAPDAVGSPFKWWIGRRWEGPSFIGRGEQAVFKGKTSLMLDGRGPCKIGVYSPPIEVKSPTKLKLTVYVQADGLAKGLYGATAAITVTDLGEKSFAGGSSAAIPAGTYAWKKLEMVCDVPAKCPFVKVFIQMYGPGRLWVDDISLTGVELTAKAGVTFSDTGLAMKSDPPLVTETPGVLKKKQAALAAMEELKKAVADAKGKGLETRYDEIPLMLGRLAFDVRWDIPEHLELREGYADYVLKRCNEAVAHLRDVSAGKAPDLKVPPHPDYSTLKLKGRYYCEGDDPKIIFSMQYHSGGELMTWFAPEGYYAGIAAVGASRYDVQQTPVWEAYQKDPETHRVFDDSWCGHIIRDKYSAGGQGRCVISLDSPVMREAIAKSIATRGIPSVKNRRAAPLYINMGFEYSYVNYDKPSGELFRKWLEQKYGTVDKLNAAWKTKLASFADVTMPSYNPMEPETNPAKYYDWGDFNCRRFTDFMKWAKGEIRKGFPDTPTTTGGGEPFGAGFWRQGIDEEGLMNEGVCDIWLSETGSRALGVTSVMDLQRSLTKEPRLILDPEYHAKPNTCFLMFLHGCGVMDYWWWPDSIGEFYDSSMKHSHLISLPEVEAVMKTALDVRRLPKLIAPFPAEKAQIAMLYPRASLIQKFPGQAGNKSPYTLEIEKSYGAAVSLDTPVGFASSKRIREGVLDEFKVLVVPGARYVEADVFDRIKEWVAKGGTLVITPTSLIADEYTRKRDYLKQIGIEITAEELPEFMAGEAKRGIDQSGELDFIQGPVAKTAIVKEPKRTVVVEKAGLFAAGPATLEAAGIIQNVKPSADWKVLAKYKGEETPAILVRKMGKGEVYYLAGSLDVPSRQIVFDRLMDALAFPRAIRAFAPDGKYPEGVESRTVAFDGALLTYLHNFTGKGVTVKLSAAKDIGDIFNVNTETKVDSPTMTLAPYETRIMKVKMK